jgi:uncharacterized radical SAM protein YgiQ
MFGMKGKDMEKCRRCSRPSCIWPQVCINLDTDHSKLTTLYRKVNSREDIKKAFIGSGVRYDLLFPEWNKNAGKAERDYLEELITLHVSGRLKVAPEHSAAHVLSLMRKAPFSLFRKLKSQFDFITKKYGLRYELIPYFISSMPGCTEQDMRELMKEVKELGVRPEQVQDFTPTPMTMSTLLYYTGKDPFTGKKVYVATRPEEKKRQKELFFTRAESDRRYSPGARKTKTFSPKVGAGERFKKSDATKKNSSKKRTGTR